MMFVHVADPARETAERHEGEDRHQGVEQDINHDREAPSLPNESTKTPKGAPPGRTGAIQSEARAASLPGESGHNREPFRPPVRRTSRAKWREHPTSLRLFLVRPTKREEKIDFFSNCFVGLVQFQVGVRTH